VSGVAIRRFVDGDVERVGEIFYRSVHEVAASAYDERQRKAWAPALPDAARWLPRLREYDTFVAEEDGAAIAWIAVTPAGYIDMLFCLPEAAGRGIASQLYVEAERLARERGIERLTAHASLLAQPFFAKHGWVIDEHEAYEKNGVVVPRASMSKRLVPPAG
jgi:putative acetyltransferase